MRIREIFVVEDSLNPQVVTRHDIACFEQPEILLIPCDHPIAFESAWLWIESSHVRPQSSRGCATLSHVDDARSALAMPTTSPIASIQSVLKPDRRA